MYEDEEQNDLITGVDEDGNEVALQIIDYFFYNGEEYAILTDAVEDEDDDAEVDEGCDAEDGEEQEGIDCYIAKVVATKGDDGEEYDEFLPVEDEALAAKLIEVATTKLNEDEEADDEE